MIKITDGNSVKEVTKGMFDNLYASMGYKEVKENNESKNVKEETTIVTENKESKKEEVKPRVASSKK